MRRQAAAIVLLLAVCLGAGCWDARSIDQRAFVVMLGVDKKADGQFRLTLQVQRAGFDQRREAKGGAAAAQLLTTEGETVRQALEKARDDLARELDTTFLDVIVLGRAVAEAGLDDLDWVVRSFRVPVSAFVTVSPGAAEEVVRAGAIGFLMPAQFALFSLMGGSWTRSAAVVPGLKWMIFNRTLYTPLEDPFAPVLSNTDSQLVWAGLAVFREHHLAGLLSERDAATFNMLLGGRAERIVTAGLPGRPKASVSLYIQGIRVKRKVIWVQNRPLIQIRLTARGNLTEAVGIRVASGEAETAVEGAVAQALSDEVRDFLRRLQELGSDPVGFGELARQAAPYRREVQTGKAWREAYQRARIDVVSKVTMAAPGYMK